MIRLIQRRLIIPQGDTGTFTIPLQGTLSTGEKALISIYDNLTRTIMLEREMEVGEDTLSYTFKTEDTINIEPDDRGNRYNWDITLLREPQTDANNQTYYANVDSYYAAFSLPPCVIKRVTRDVQK